MRCFYCAMARIAARSARAAAIVTATPHSWNARDAWPRRVESIVRSHRTIGSE
jgi:hypothetical protein